MSGTPWWRNAVIYQVYLRSFADGNGDGTGDIAGLRSRLPYIRSLGVDAVWINPWYRSPLRDGGYDVADYRSIDPRFGTLDEATEMIEEASELGLRVLLDLVPNHTSSEHRWFQEALSSPPGSPPRHRYHFRPGSGTEGTRPPNNWRSVFGGPAWTRVPDGEWVSSWDRLALYMRPDEYHQAFDFRFMLLPWDPEVMKEAIDTAWPGPPRWGRCRPGSFPITTW